MKLALFAAAVIGAAVGYAAVCATRLPPVEPMWFDALHDHEFWPRVNDHAELVH